VPLEGLLGSSLGLELHEQITGAPPGKAANGLLEEMFAGNPICVFEGIALPALGANRHFAVRVRDELSILLARAANDRELGGHGELPVD
jgi:hypothetical protein